VLAVHGFDGYAARDCREFAALQRALRGRLRTVGYYAGDTHADLTLPGPPASTDTSITALGPALAELISAQPAPVDLIGHSMGGLVVQESLGYLRTGRVRRIVMLGVPFAGLPSAAGTAVAQCVEMTPGSSFLEALAGNGIQADLVVASAADEAVPPESATQGGAPTLLMPADRNVHHGDLLTDPEVIAAVRRTLR
jgi:pimeloyl-ACP methyl ester carboxylesterase